MQTTGCGQNVARFVSVVRESGAAFVYPQLQQFGEKCDLMGNCPFEPGRIIGGNYIDALALVSKEAWAAVGGYRVFRVMGWEDNDFWCRLVENGFWGCRAGDSPLAEYRVHGNSMLRTITDRNTRQLFAEMEDRHTWLDLSALAQLPQEAQEVIAAGFEYIGRRPFD